MVVWYSIEWYNILGWLLRNLIEVTIRIIRYVCKLWEFTLNSFTATQNTPTAKPPPNKSKAHSKAQRTPSSASFGPYLGAGIWLGAVVGSMTSGNGLRTPNMEPQNVVGR